MSGNKHLLANKSKFLKKKLEKLANELDGSLGNASLQTQEAYIFATLKALREFYKSIQEPQLDRELIETVRADHLPNVDIYNKIWQQTIDDLISVFTELENIEDLTVSNFNFIATEANRLTAKLKSVDSKLGDYILFSLSPSKDVFFYKDSFNDLSKVDVNSGLLNATECNINQTEGIATLPLNREEDSLIIMKQLPIINPSSDGVIGNNQELGAAYNGNIAVLLDNNPDTWFEYEKVVSLNTNENESLTLDLTMNLGEEKVINHIRINPNNFGTKTTIQIDEIETSIDGQVYVSIKDDVPIAGFTTQDEENIFILAPSTSKFAGQGLYTFTPRKVRYIRFVFKQIEPYIIETSAGNRQRYAIGIRDIDVRGYTYDSLGEIVSTPFQSTREIKKVILETNQNPTQISELARIQYFISPNDGGSWFEIQPKEFQGPSGLESVPEILDFNTGDSDSISTPVPVKSVRLKARFSREDDLFEDGSSSLNKTIVNKSELHTIPQSAPFSIDLEEPPVDGTVLVVDPMFGSRGLEDSQYIIGHAVDRLDFRRYRLPFKSFPRPFKKVSDGGNPATYHLEPVPASEYMHVEVGGEEWSHASQPIGSYTLDFANLANYKLYAFHPNTGILEFGDGITTSLAPAENQPVSVYFEPERLFPSETEDNHVAQLDFKTSNNKNDFTIKRYDELIQETEILPRKATVVRLENQNIEDTVSGIATSLSAAGYNTDPQDFVNGKEELTVSGHWSMDMENGIIYLYNPTPATEDISVVYDYIPVTELTTDDWDWTTSNLLRDSIAIKESAWQTTAVTDEELPSTQNTKILDFSKMSIVKDTVELSVTVSGVALDTENESHPFFREVDFVNGVEELGGQFKKAKENIPNDLVPVGNIATFDLKENVSTKTSEHPVVFSNTTMFSNLVAGAGSISSEGDYYVERSASDPDYGTVAFYLDATTYTPGTVTYFYASSNFSESGLYSIDYKLGRIYTQRAVNSGGSSEFDITCSYQYTDYRAEYRIARFLDLDSYEVDISNQRISFLDKEILKYLQVPHSTLDGRTPFYLVNYDYVAETREDISDLGSKFTPVLKDYVLRILTKGNIV